jgi:hypothetical protein
MEKIILKKGQELKNEKNLVVHSDGEYESDELVLVCDKKNTDLPLYQYTSFYIEYGVNNNIIE